MDQRLMDYVSVEVEVGISKQHCPSCQAHLFFKTYMLTDTALCIHILYISYENRS